MSNPYCVDSSGHVAACASPLSVLQILQLAYNAGFRGLDLIRAAAIAMAESTGMPNITNGTAYGLMQINLSAHPGVSVAQANDPQQAMDYAYQLKSARGNFCDWQSYDSGVCGSSSYDNHYKTWVPQVVAQAASMGGAYGSAAAAVEPGANSGPAGIGDILGAIQQGLGDLPANGVPGSGPTLGDVAGAVGAVAGGVGGAVSAATDIPGALGQLGNKIGSLAGQFMWIGLGLVLAILGVFLLVNPGSDIATAITEAKGSGGAAAGAQEGSGAAAGAEAGVVA